MPQRGPETRLCIAANAAVRAGKPGRARRFDVDAADEVWLNLPAGTVSDVAVTFPEVHLQRRLITALLVVNR